MKFRNFVILFAILIFIVSSAFTGFRQGSNETMSAEQLALIAGALLSLAFSYIPGVKTWFETLSSEYKQMSMGIMLVVVAGTVYGLSCASVFGYFTCDQNGLLELIDILVKALIANQAVYLITRK